jgi:UDP-N-acetylmuramyl pentapeptide phosphotransferase/UDP-N-acetylglucosamine-1-phosphate transferase
MVILGLGVIVFSYFGVAAVRYLTLQHNILDIPNERSSHVIPTPRGGGLAIVIVTLISIAVLLYIKPHWPIHGLFSIFLGAILVAGISLWDDIHPLPYWIRLAVHVAVAAIVVFQAGDWKIVQIPYFKALDLGWIGIPMTMVWIVGMINAYNFMDGVDGIAGGQGMVAGLGWVVLGILSGQFFIAGIGMVLAASCLGFLGHNWSPAKIFMGDVGSTFLGYIFAVLPVVAGQHDTHLTFAGVLLVWPFIFDPAITFLRRLFQHENVFSAHVSHYYQRLVATGFSHKKIALLYMALSILGLACSVFLILGWPWADNLTVIMLFTTSLFLWLGTRCRERTATKAVSS